MKDKDIKNILDDNLCILIDTREKKNQHIIKAFDEYNIKYKKQKIDYGDYGCIITPNGILGNKDDIQMKVSVERKAHLQEIGSNLTKDKKRFSKEMQRCIDDNGSMIIVIEKGTYKDIVDKNYENDITQKSFLALLHSIYATYDIPFIFIDVETSPLFIYDVLKYFTRAYLKNNY